MTNVPVSVFVTSLSFAWYLAARFVLGPLTMGSEGRRLADSAPLASESQHH